MVKQGYKQTEIGVIPEDWEVDYLSNMSFRIGDGIHSTPIYSEQDNFYFINGNNLGNGSISIDSATKTVSFEQYKLHKRDLGSNSILLSINGTIGNIAFYKNESIILGKSACYINLKNGVNKKYIFYTLQSNFVQMYFEDNLTGSTIKNLGLGTISNTQIPLPPLAEQEAIAAALSDADTWIESLEQLIVKKRLIKQGVMQNLLTPKGNWVMTTIYEVADKKRDLFNDGDWIESDHIVDDGIRLVQTGNIGVGKFLNKGNRKFISEQSFEDLKCKELKEGDLLICRLAEPAGRACIFPKTEDYKSVTSVDVTIFRPDELKYNREFLMYIFCTNDWFTSIIEKVGGTTHKRISRGNLGNITIKTPSFLEQTRIATILSDIDAELETLENQLAKARQIKQGMMQELLTGRVRLV